MTYSRNNTPISCFGYEQADTLFKILVFQKLCPGKFLIQDPWHRDEMNTDEVEVAKEALRELMPLDTVVTDMRDWDIHFEDSTFVESYFNVALGSEDYALEQAENLKDDILGWIEEYRMDYNQAAGEEEFEEWVRQQCRDFILKWRANITKKFTGPT